MDPDQPNKENQQAAEVRRLRLQWAAAQSTGEAASTGERDVENEESSGVGVPVASSTLLSPAVHSAQLSHISGSVLAVPGAPTAAPTRAQWTPTTTPAPASTGFGNETTAVLLINGRDAQDLLRSLQHILSQRNLLTTIGSSELQDVAAAAATATEREPSPGLAGNSRSKVQVISSVSSESSADDVQERMKAAAKSFKCKKPLIHQNWRESLPSTSRAGLGDEKPPAIKRRRGPGRPLGSNKKPARPHQSYDSDPEDDPSSVQVSSDSSCEENARAKKPTTNHSKSKSAAALPSSVKRGPGRPKGSKNKSKKEQSCASDNSGLSCHICREGRDGGAFCLTDCGHLFHKKCLDRWIATSSQEYRTHKTCPYCGGTFQSSIPFYG